MIWIDLDPAYAGARVRHFGQRRFFKISRALPRVDEVRDQIRAPLIHILHLRPALIDFLLQANQPIIAARDSAPADQDEEKNDGTDAETPKKTFIHRRYQLARRELADASAQVSEIAGLSQSSDAMVVAGAVDCGWPASATAAAAVGRGAAGK